MSRSKEVVSELDDDAPWYLRLDYIEGIAALATMRADEVPMKTYVAGKKVGMILWRSAASDRVEWMWNCSRTSRMVEKCRA